VPEPIGPAEASPPGGRALRIVEATAADKARWNAFLSADEDASPLARYEWAPVIQATYGADVRFFVAQADDAIVGILPTYTTRSLRGRRHLYSLRHGLRAVDEAAAAALLTHVRELRACGDVRSVVVTSGWRCTTAAWPVTRRKTLVLDIDEDEELMWRGLRDKTRNMIRKAEKSGLTMAAGRGYVDVLYEQYRDNMLRIGVQIHARAFFDNVLDQFGDDAEVLVALHDGRPVASMLLLYQGGVACYPYQSAVYEFRRLAPVQFLNWQAMNRCRQRGVRLLDMGESGEGSPVYSSKVNFGGKPRDLFYYRADGTTATGTPAASAKAEMSSWCERAEGYLRTDAPTWLRHQYALWRLRHGRII